MERGRVWTPWIQDAEDEIGASLRKIPHHSKERVLSVAQATPPRARPLMTLLGSSSSAPQLSLFCRFFQIFGLWYRKGCGTEEPEASGRRVHGTGIFLPLLPAAHWSCHPEHMSFLPISKHRYCLGIFLLPACTQTAIAFVFISGKVIAIPSAVFQTNRLLWGWLSSEGCILSGIEKLRNALSQEQPAAPPSPHAHRSSELSRL